MSWRDRAACNGKEELFFPRTEKKAADALAICETCPVTTQCAAYARRKGVDAGVWGGRVYGVEFGFQPRREARGGRGGKRPGAGRPHIIDLDELAPLSDLPAKALAEIFGVQERTVYRRLQDLAEAEALGEVASASVKEAS